MGSIGTERASCDAQTIPPAAHCQSRSEEAAHEARVKKNPRSLKLIFDHVAREFVAIVADSSYGELGDGRPKE